MKSPKKSGLASFQRFFSASGKSWNCTPFAFSSPIAFSPAATTWSRSRYAASNETSSITFCCSGVSPSHTPRAIHTAFVGPSHSVMSCTCLATS